MDETVWCCFGMCFMTEDLGKRAKEVNNEYNSLLCIWTHYSQVVDSVVTIKIQKKKL